MTEPSQRFPKEVNLAHRALTPEELKSIRSARSQGWFIAKGEPTRRSVQKDAWFLLCYENRADYVCFEATDEGLQLESQKTDKLPLSRIFFQEKQEFCTQWGLRDVTRVRIPKRIEVAQLAAELLDLYARDRTTQRTLELERSAFEGMAEVVCPEKYWPEQKGQTIYAYVIPIRGTPGRCVALAHQRLPLVDVDLKDFRLLESQP